MRGSVCASQEGIPAKEASLFEMASRNLSRVFVDFFVPSGFGTPRRFWVADLRSGYDSYVGSGTTR